MTEVPAKINILDDQNASGTKSMSHFFQGFPWICQVSENESSMNKIELLEFLCKDVCASKL
jgi:hypothetical protein